MLILRLSEYMLVCSELIHKHDGDGGYMRILLQHTRTDKHIIT